MDKDKWQPEEVITPQIDIDAAHIALEYNLDKRKTKRAIERWGKEAVLKSCAVGDKPYFTEKPIRKKKKSKRKSQKIARRKNRK